LKRLGKERGYSFTTQEPNRSSSKMREGAEWKAS
jgi:hypothetical protein